MEKTAATPVIWAIDPIHSRITFEVKYLMITSVTGWFREFEGAVSAPGGEFDQSEIDLTIYSHSLFTGVEERDQHLRSADFFDTTRYPVIAFRSSRVVVSREAVEITGLLTIKDTRKEISFTARYIGSVNDPMGNTKAGFEIDTMFNRKDFDISWNQYFDQQGILIGDQVRVRCDVQLLKIS